MSLLKRFAYVSVAIFMAWCVPLTAPLAHAEDRCTSYVVDEAGIFGTDTTRVTTAIKGLEEVGADGRVVAIKSFGNAGSLDTYIDQMARSCTSWQMSGKLKQNFFVLAIALQERKVTIYYGTLWKSRFDTQASVIQSSDMAPLFKQSRFADGMIAGVESIKRTIKAPVAPSRNDNPAPAPSQTQPSAPFPWNALFIVVGSIVGVAIAVIVFIMLILPWIRRRRESRELRRRAITLRDRVTAEAKTLEAAIYAPDQFAYLEDFSVTDGDTQVKAKQLQVEIQNSLVKAQQAIEHAAKLGNPQLHLSDDQYAKLISAYSKALESIEQAKSCLEQRNALHDELIKQANESAAQISVLNEQLNGANTSLLDLTNKGIDAAAFAADLEQVRSELSQYNDLQDASAIVVINELPELTEKVQTLTAAIADTLESIEFSARELNELPVLHQAAIDKRRSSGAAFERMSAQYAPDSWENIAGNGTKADKLLFRAKEMLDHAATATVVDVVQLKSQIESLIKIRQLIEEGEVLYDAIVARESNIAEAQRTAGDEIRFAESDIAKAASYLEQAVGDVDKQLARALQEACKHLGAAQRELEKEQPNYLAVVKQALLANGAADEVYAKAVEQHEYMESIRHQLETTRSLFAASFDKSERYIENHDSVVGDDARSLLRKAKRTFERINKQAEFVAMLQVAQEALEYANSAYDSAYRDVAAIEAERRREREAREAAERKARQRREEEEEAARRRRSSYYSSPSTYGGYSSSSHSYDFGGSSSSSSFGGGDFGGSSGSSGW